MDGARGVTPQERQFDGSADQQVGDPADQVRGLVYDLPIKKRASVDWSTVALALDDLDVGAENLGSRLEELPLETKRQILRLD